jgi:hypothetical protein
MSAFTEKLSAFFLGRAKRRAPDVVTIMMVTGCGCPVCDDTVGGCSACNVPDDAPRAIAAGTINPPIRER